MSRSEKRAKKQMRQLTAAANAAVRAAYAEEHERLMTAVAKRVDRLKGKEPLIKKTAAELRELAQEAKKEAKQAKQAESAWGKYSRSLIVQTGRGRGLPITSTAEKTSRAIYGSSEKSAVSKGPGVIYRKKSSSSK